MVWIEKNFCFKKSFTLLFLIEMVWVSCNSSTVNCSFNLVFFPENGAHEKEKNKHTNIFTIVCKDDSNNTWHFFAQFLDPPPPLPVVNLTEKYKMDSKESVKCTFSIKVNVHLKWFRFDCSDFYEFWNNVIPQR